MSAAPVLQRLRAATAEAHARLDAGMQMTARVSDPDRRRRMVQAFHRFHASVETLLARRLGATEGVDLQARSRLPLLAADLKALDAAPIGADAVDGAGDEAWGWLYVAEGSSLGGHVIRRDLAHAGVDLRGLSFLDPYGDQVGPRWRQLVAEMDRRAQAGDLDMDAAARGACHAFDYAHTVLLEGAAR